MGQGLPKIEKKYYETKLPSNGKTVKFSKMTIGQQKEVMLTAEEPEKLQRLMINIVDSCVDVDVNKLCKVDFISLGYDLRATSDGKIIKFNQQNVRFIDKNDDKDNPKELLTYDEIMNPDLFFDVENEEQRNERVKEIIKQYHKIKHPNKFELNIAKDIEITDGKYTDVIDLTDTVKVHLKAPTVEQIRLVDEKPKLKPGEKEIYYRMMCIDKVVTEDEVYNDYTFEELEEFFNECVDQEDFEKIEEFYNQIPKLVSKKEFKCSKWKDILVKKGDSVEDFL